MHIGKLDINLTKVYVFVSGSIGGVLLSLFGEFNEFLYTLLYFMVVDFVVGYILAMMGYSSKTENGCVESRQVLKGVAKKIYILVLITVVYKVEGILNVSGLRDIVVSGFIAFELTSLLEHAKLLGIDVPQALKDVVDKFASKEKKGLDNDDI